MSHAHDHRAHDHTHSHPPAGRGGSRETRLLIAFVLTALALVAEAVGGWLSGSLALLADAGHMLVDAAALMFAWLAAYFAKRPADALRSFGYARLEVLVGYSNALLQFVLVVWIVVEAAMRLQDPQPILSGTMLFVALFGLAVNAFVLFVLSGHAHDDLNTASARLHVLGDLFGSVGAVAAALLIRGFGWLWTDPLISVLVSLLILASAWRLLRRSAHILLEGVPDGLDTVRVGDVLKREAEGVRDVHHVHVWQIAGGYHLATLHVRLQPGASPAAAIRAVHEVLHDRFDIGHATVQIEDDECAGAPCAHS